MNLLFQRLARYPWDSPSDMYSFSSTETEENYEFNTDEHYADICFL